MSESPVSSEVPSEATVNAHIAPPAAPSPKQVKRWRKYLAEERMEEQTYRTLAARMEGEDQEILIGLANAEKRHQQHWETLLGDLAHPAPKPPAMTRLTAWLAQHFGSMFVLALAQRSEQRTAYDAEGDASEQMAADEHIHGEVIRSLAAKSRERLAGPLRAGLFGANDGLVSNLALILGVTGAGMSTNYVLITGVSGLLAGALSMGAGEWVSVSGQRELLDASKPDPEAGKSVPALDIRANELELLFRARGEDEAQAARHAAAIFAQAAAGDTVTLSLPWKREGGSAGQPIEQEGSPEAIGTPWQAARSSFLFFAIGAILPLLPYLFGLAGITGAVTSVIIVGAALLFTGSLVSVLSGRSPLKGALRQVSIGYGAAAVTFLLGLLFGTG